MSNLDDLLKTKQAEKLALLETVAPSGWERGNERTGDYGTGSTGPIPPEVDVTEEYMLQRAGFDPSEWMIVGDVNYREWDANVGGGEIRTMTYRKFNVRRRAASGADIKELIKLVNKRKRPPVAGRGEQTFHFANGDWQLGKIDGDGTEGIVDRFLNSVDAAVAEFKKARKDGARYVHITFLGDCMEGFVSQGGKNAWRTELTLTEQLRLMRRMMLYAIDAFAPLTDRLTVVAVPGNHDEAIREPGITRFDDSFIVDALVAVTDAMEMNPTAYGHVETYVPRTDELTVTLNVNGTIVLHGHGHYHRPLKHWDWWQASSFDRRVQDAFQADLLLEGHFHHHMIDTKGDRMYVIIPSQEEESTWWRHRSGDRGRPGALIFTTYEGVAEGFKVV